MLKAYSPKGTEIVATLEKVYGKVGIESWNADKTVEYDSNGTDVDWDSQVTVTRKGQEIFLDDDGQEWPFDQLVFKDEEDDDEEEDA